MKKLTITLSTLMIFLFICAFANAQIKVPPQVKTAFESRFATAEKVSWGKENAHEYEGEFLLDGKHYSANFLADGKWKETEAEISKTDLPASVLNAFNRKYAGSQIKMCSKITAASGTVKYEIEYLVKGKTKEVLYDEEGKPAKE